MTVRDDAVNGTCEHFRRPGVNEGVKPDGTIVVGVDESSHAERATDWALEEARCHIYKVLLVDAWQYPSLGVASFAGDPLPVFGRDELQKLAAEVLSHAATRARERDPTVELETRLVEGHPGASPLEASDRARLLVVGSRGLGGFWGALLGSVSSACAHRARSPVVVVPSVAGPAWPATAAARLDWRTRSYVPLARPKAVTLRLRLMRELLWGRNRMAVSWRSPGESHTGLEVLRDHEEVGRTSPIGSASFGEWAGRSLRGLSIRGEDLGAVNREV
jgi:nucleotide-binding universal stress UspA family protein